MQTLPSECVAHIVSFLTARDALCLAQTATLYNEIVASNKDRVQKYVAERKTDIADTLLSADIFGNVNFCKKTKETWVSREIFKPATPCIVTISSLEGAFLKKEKHGVWKETTIKDPWKKTGSLWVKEKLIYIHIIISGDEHFAVPVENPGKDTFFWRGHAMRITFCRFQNDFLLCGGKSHPSFFESVRCAPFALCCSKHRGSLPEPLFD